MKDRRCDSCAGHADVCFASSGSQNLLNFLFPEKPPLPLPPLLLPPPPPLLPLSLPALCFPLPLSLPDLLLPPFPLHLP